jgi:hypothetical protein
MKKLTPIFKFHVPKKELGKYFDPVCALCGRKRSEINKLVNFQGIKCVEGMTIIKIDGKTQPICDECIILEKEKT